MLKHLFTKRRDKSVDMSVPRDFMLHGVRIHKLPTGRYLQMLRLLEDTPATLMTALFPGQDVLHIFDSLKGMDNDGILALLTRALTTVPQELVRLLCPLLQIKEDLLLSPDDGLSLTELAEVLAAFVEANDLSDFWPAVRRILTGGKPSTGSKT